MLILSTLPHGYLKANFATVLIFKQELKEKQKEFESKAVLFGRLNGEGSGARHEPAFKNSTAPLQRKPSAASKANRQQAVVQPLQGRLEKLDEFIWM